MSQMHIYDWRQMEHERVKQFLKQSINDKEHQQI
ncbi:hypothetical protein L345_10230, partial [Ophiophagus hannah]